MSANADIDALSDAFTFLRGALDADDTPRLVEAARRVSVAIDGVRTHGAWRSDEQLRAKLATLLPMVESARIRINVTTDDLRRRIAMLADRGGHEARITYGR